jgi:collagenase-like PrtC family protease
VGLGELLATTGDLKGAKDILERGLALSNEIGLRGPDKNSSRRTLESLAKEARAAGFNLIAASAARQCCSTR